MNASQRAARSLLASAAAQDSGSGELHVQAAVTAVDGSSRATVRWGGQTFGTRRNAAYTPVVGDQVLVVFASGSSPVILCKIV